LFPMNCHFPFEEHIKNSECKQPIHNYSCSLSYVVGMFDRCVEWIVGQNGVSKSHVL
jgi:hypothetical protein